MISSVSETFSKIYQNNVWGNGSGVGSLPEHTVGYRKTLIDLIRSKNIRTVLDYGCGDWQFSSLIPWRDLVDYYTGVDVVDFVVDDLSKKFSSDSVDFQLVTDHWRFPESDLIICKDVMQHIPNAIVRDLLAQMIKNSRYVLLTNDVLGPQKDTERLNSDCEVGDWRPLDFSLQPWNLSVQKLLTWQDPAGAIKDTVLLSGDL